MNATIQTFKSRKDSLSWASAWGSKSHTVKLGNKWVHVSIIGDAAFILAKSSFYFPLTRAHTATALAYILNSRLSTQA